MPKRNPYVGYYKPNKFAINHNRQGPMPGRGRLQSSALAGLDSLDRRYAVKEALRDLGPVVYFLRFDGLVKIGFTANLCTRLEGLHRAARHLLAVVPGGRPEEREMHARFEFLHAERELYYLGPDLVDFINEVREAAGVLPLAVSDTAVAQPETLLGGWGDPLIE